MINLIQCSDVIFMSVKNLFEQSDIRKETHILLLDDYEFYPIHFLERLLFDNDHYNIAAGASTLNRKIYQKLSVGLTEICPAQIYLDRVCTQLTMKDDWVFNSLPMNLYLTSHPVRVVLDGRDMESFRDQEVRLKEMIGEENMKSEFYMIRS